MVMRRASGIAYLRPRTRTAPGQRAFGAGIHGKAGRRASGYEV